MPEPSDLCFATVQTLNGRVGDFAALVGLVLVLVTLFTSQRDSRLKELSAAAPTNRELTTEVWLNRVLAVFTALLFLAGLPLVLDCIKSLHPLSDSGPLRVAFTMVWLLLIALIGWQCSLAHAACSERKRWKEKRGKSMQSTSPPA